MRAVLPLLILSLLAACATPLEQCQARVTQDLRTVEALIDETEANLRRGYALRREERLRSRMVACVGARATRFCRETYTTTELVPEAVDLDAERRKLISLNEKRRELQRRSAEGLAACRAAYAG